MWPSPLASASLIISSTSSSVKRSPIVVMTWRNSAAEINPLPSRSNTLNASRISSSESVSFIFRAIMVRNSGKSIVPSLSTSTSWIISDNSLSEGFNAKLLMTVPSSLVVILPGCVRFSRGWGVAFGGWGSAPDPGCSCFAGDGGDSGGNDSSEARGAAGSGAQPQPPEARGERTIVVLIEQRKCLFKRGDLLFGQLVSLFGLLVPVSSLITQPLSPMSRSVISPVTGLKTL
ncbi:calmodulin [Sugiyamaella lignohabitans]|uniref:Calmodulin n=1 Tax=Sugiyamaella lignohabitans TaxID=796027 RepID=A0A161HKW7_9ASCO|nr:calmodulin [Sugiyamaella lignohabitans]ANB13797.1 calmodulin [Sugiyamaella lignohabitans]